MEDALALREEDDETTERRSLVLARWMLVMATGALLLITALEREISIAAVVLVMAFAASNVLLKAFWSSLITKPGADIMLAVLDTLFLGLAIAISAIATSELFVLSFLVVFLVA